MARKGQQPYREARFKSAKARQSRAIKSVRKSKSGVKSFMCYIKGHVAGGSRRVGEGKLYKCVFVC